MNFITKQQEQIDNFKMNMYYFDSAREPFEYILKNILSEKTLLIPAYIGYSTREGSGIFDPIKNSKVKYKFYRMKNGLDIDLSNLFQLIDDNPNSVLLLVHYFGFYDKALEKIKAYANDKSVVVVEDCAHAFFTFYQKPKIESDYYLFSLHKMFVFNKGGLLISKNNLKLETEMKYNPFEYNLYQISQKRINNYNYLSDKLKNITKIKILKNSLGDNVPQTFPIILESVEIRDKLYFSLNEIRFGVVSLYHELINELNCSDYKYEIFLSQCILNLPIHQDVNFSDIDEMIIQIEKILYEN